MKNAFAHIRKVVFGMTQADFARAVKVNQSTVSRWEKGQLDPDINDLRRIRALAKKEKDAIQKRGSAWSDDLLFKRAA